MESTEILDHSLCWTLNTGDKSWSHNFCSVMSAFNVLGGSKTVHHRSHDQGTALFILICSLCPASEPNWAESLPHKDWVGVLLPEGGYNGDSILPIDTGCETEWPSTGGNCKQVIMVLPSIQQCVLSVKYALSEGMERQSPSCWFAGASSKDLSAFQSQWGRRGSRRMETCLILAYLTKICKQWLAS